MLASANGRLDVVKLLLEKGPGIDVNYINSGLLTALRLAAAYGHLDVVKLLLKAGPTYYVARNARMEAASQNHPRIYRAIDRWMQGYYKLRYEIEGEGGIGAAAGAMKS